jgi:poly-gamma-glutamate capsule biosynthesis protein CapA/YwtB (metallophosphatase superfamily)
MKETKRPSSIDIALGGDVMLTRRVSRNRDTEFLRLVDVLRAADVTFANLETCVRWWDEGSPSITTGTPMTTTPDLLDELKWLGIDMVSCANNHVYDYGEIGALANLRHMREAGIPQAGCGRNLYEARLPAFHDSACGRVGLIAMTSTFRPWNAASASRGEVPGRPGVNPLRHKLVHRVDQSCFDALMRMSRELGLVKESERAKSHSYADKEVTVASDRSLSLFGQTIQCGSEFTSETEVPEKELKAHLASISEARRQCDFLIVSLHTHEFSARSLKTESLKVNLSEPADFIRQMAHAAIDAGADVVAGHGSHTALGIELYRGKPIFYSLGGLLFQNETLPYLPAETYERFDLGAEATPADLFDARTKNDTKSFPAHAGYWECFVPVCRFGDKGLERIQIIPTDLGFGLPRHHRGLATWAQGEVADKILRRLSALSAAFGTKLTIQGDTASVLM